MITLNGETSGGTGVQRCGLLCELELKREHVAVEVNADWSLARTRDQVVKRDVLEVYTLWAEVAANRLTASPSDWRPFISQPFIFGTAITRHGTDAQCWRLLVQRSYSCRRRERLQDASGRRLLDFIDMKRLTIYRILLMFSADEACVRHDGARDPFGIGQCRCGWVKVGNSRDQRTLLPDPVATLEATASVGWRGISRALLYGATTDHARRLKAAGAAA